MKLFSDLPSKDAKVEQNSTKKEVLYDFPPDTVSPVQEQLPPPLSLDAMAPYDSPPVEFRVEDVVYNDAIGDERVDEVMYGKVTGDGRVPEDQEEEIPTSPLPVVTYRALYGFTATGEGEVSFVKGDILSGSSDYKHAQDGWIMVTLNGEQGWAPVNYLQPFNKEGTCNTHQEPMKNTWAPAHIQHSCNT